MSIRKSNDLRNNDYELLCDSLKGFSPFTTTFRYKLPEKRKQKYYFAPGSFYAKKQILKITKGRINYCYLFPGVFDARIINENEEILASERVIVYSDSWETCVSKDKNRDHPILFSNEPVQPKNGYAYLSKVQVARQNLDTNSNYWVDFYNFHEFGIDGDNFVFHSSVLNNSLIGGLRCYDIILRVYGKTGMHRVHFTEKGCEYFVLCKFAEKIMNGRDQDLSAFGVNIEDWIDIKITIKDRDVKVYVKNDELLKIKYNEPVGDIIGISFIFKGCGSIDYVKLHSDSNKYIENFD
jgi:hypothetical protein